MLITTLSIVAQAPSGGGSLATAANVSIIVIAVAIVGVTLMAGGLWLRFNRILAELQRSARQNFGPVSDRARSISDNVEFVTQALRTDVEKLNASIRALSDRLQQASDHMEERIDEFNALMAVVQDEAEDIFLDTASTVRGVREGARAIAGGGEGDRSPGESEAEGVHPEEQVVERAAPPADGGNALPDEVDAPIPSSGGEALPEPEEKAISGGET